MQDWLSQRARATPEREALVVADTENRWDYGTLDETVDEMAGRLAAHGVDAGDHVGAVLETGAEQVCLVHAAMRLGAVLVPYDPAFTAPELGERLDRADVSLVVCDEATEQVVVEANAEEGRELSMLTVGEPQWTEVTSLAAIDPTAFDRHAWDRRDVQLLLFTSGTTGRPKVVELTQGNLLASAVASGFRLGVDPDDRWLVPLSLHHMGGIAPVLRSTLYGTTTVVRASFEPGRTVDDIQSHDATAISLVPTMLRRMLSSRGTLPDSLRFVLVGGAPCPVELIERCRNFSVPVCPTYGMTETASQVATARHSEAYGKPSSVGRPLLWTDVTVVDDDGTPLPAGESGELVVAGPTVSPGYYGDAAATDEATGEYGFHTGDVGYFDEDGRLFVVNRLDDRIVSGGENVDPGEVVDALLDHPDVAEAAVVGLPDEEWGERVGALVVPDDEPPLVGELESFLRNRLASYKLPRTVGFADELPRTVSGTVERGAVREQLLEGATDAIEYAESDEGEDEETAPDSNAEEEGEGAGGPAPDDGDGPATRGRPDDDAESESGSRAEDDSRTDDAGEDGDAAESDANDGGATENDEAGGNDADDAGAGDSDAGADGAGENETGDEAAESGVEDDGGAQSDAEDGRIGDDRAVDDRPVGDGATNSDDETGDAENGTGGGADRLPTGQRTAGSRASIPDAETSDDEDGDRDDADSTADAGRSNAGAGADEE